MGEEQPPSIQPETSKPTVPSLKSSFLPESTKPASDVKSEAEIEALPPEQQVESDVSQSPQTADTLERTVEKPQTVEDRVIAEQLTAVENEIKELEANQKRTKEEEEQLKDRRVLLATLKLGSEGNGKGGIFLKKYALGELARIKGTANVGGLEMAMISVAGRLTDAQKELIEFAINFGGLSREEIQNLVQGGAQAAERLITSGKVLNNKNLLTYFFGRELKPEELTSMLAGTGLSPEHLNFLQAHGKEAKGGLLILLLLALMGAKNAFTDLAMPQRAA